MISVKDENKAKKGDIQFFKKIVEDRMAWDGFATNQCSTEIDKRPDKKLRQGFIGVLGGSDGKESICNAGDLGLVSGSRRSRGKGNGNPPQYSCLGIPWTEEPGGKGLQSMWSQRVRPDLATEQ